MELCNLSECKQQLLHPLIKLKTESSLGSLISLRDVFADLADAYGNFAAAVKKIEQRTNESYRVASTGCSNTQASEALLLVVGGNVPNVDQAVSRVIAEQSGRSLIFFVCFILIYRHFKDFGESIKVATENACKHGPLFKYVTTINF